MAPRSYNSSPVIILIRTPCLFPSSVQLFATAAASGGAGPYEYQFKLKNGTVVTEVKAYATPCSTWGWDTAGFTAGSYTVYLYARNVGSVAVSEASKGLTYTIN